MIKIEHFRMPIAVEMGMSKLTILKRAEEVERQLCRELETFKNNGNKKILSIQFGRHINGSYIEDSFYVYIDIMYDDGMSIKKL